MKKENKLGIKIGTKREAWWINLKNRCEEAISNSKEGIIADTHLLELAEKIIAEEKNAH